MGPIDRQRELAMRARIVARLFGDTVEVRIGRYRVLDELGRGGLGVVYEAHDPELDRRVALKVIRPEAAARVGIDEMHRRLRREAQAMARLNHPNVVSVFDVGRDGASVFITMELVDGVTLEAWRAGRSWRERLHVLLQAGRGLAAAHEHGIIHRDFKPSNVIVDANGDAHVLDFGLARAAGEPTADTIVSGDDPVLGEELTRTGALMGTPRYMAPEQFDGLPVDPRTDEWAFCVTAWELLFDARPFAGESLEELRQAVHAGVLPSVASDVPASVRRAIARGLAVRLEDRHGSMGALLRTLERATRSRRSLWLAAVGAVALVGVSVTATAALLGGGNAATVAQPSIVVSDLRAVWTTPHQIRWEWAAEGDPDRLLHYEIITGPSRETVLARGPDTRRWTDDDNPELGRFLRPKTKDVDAVRSTITDAFEPSTQVYAQLVATDTSGVESASNIAAARTQEEATQEIVVLSEDAVRGVADPPGFDRSRAAPFRGESHYRHRVDCEGEPECWIVMRRDGLGIAIDPSELSRGNYETTAYLEIALAIRDSTPPWWSEIWLWHSDDDHTDDFSRLGIYRNWTARADGRYHVWEIPLRAFTRKGKPIAYDEIVQHPLHLLGVSGSWTHGATIDVDEVRIRW